MKAIECIRIGFENCECFEFTKDHISFIALRDIKDNIIFGNNYLHDYSSCESVSIQLKSISNTMKVKLSTYNGDAQLPFDRILQYPDIVSIEVCYTNDTSIGIYAKWEDHGHRDSNAYQTAKINDNGDMCIVIDKDETVATIFEVD